MTYKGLQKYSKAKEFLELAVDKFNTYNQIGNGYLAYNVYPIDVDKALKQMGDFSQQTKI